MNPRQPFSKIISIILTFTLLHPELLFAQASYFALTSLPTPGVYEYDLRSNLTKVIDAKGNSTQFIYNETNQLTQTSNPLNKSEYFKYDANRNLVSLLNRNAESITFGYDLANQLIKKYLPTNQVTTYSYDSVGNLTSITDPDTKAAFTYDLANRLTSSSTVDSPYQPGSTLTYTYDGSFNRISMFDPQGTTTYLYDTLNRLKTLTNPHSKTTSFTYDAISRRTTLTHANGTGTTYSYDAASQLTSLSNVKGTTPISKFDYAYDKIGNRKSMQELSGINNYTYDLLNRLITAAHPQPDNPQESFSYDGVGNRLTSHLSSIYRYDDLNRLLEDDPYLYTYDDNGNMIEKTDKTTLSKTRYSYDAENQLIRIDSPGGSWATYRYDGLGRRFEKNVNGTITRYIYDNEDILLEYDSSNTLKARYTHGPGIDEPLIMRRGTQDYFYHVDGLGSVKEITDSTGNITQTYTYDSFGRIIAQTGSLTNPYTYTGREYDSESGLYYYRARYYDARIGRFLQEDPIKGFLTNPKTLNLYPYVGNSPVNFIDPYGNQLAETLTATWGGALLEPTFVGEVVATVVTAVVLGRAVADAISILLAKKAKVKGAKIEEGEDITEDEAVERAKEKGGDVVAGSQEEAERIARKAGCGQTPEPDDPHDKGKSGKPKPGDYRPHYHPHGRKGGHIFYPPK